MSILKNKDYRDYSNKGVDILPKDVVRNLEKNLLTESASSSAHYYNNLKKK
jgi:hypothetical protein